MKRLLKVFSLNPSIALLPGGAIPYAFISLIFLNQFRYSKTFIYGLYFGMIFLLFFLNKFEHLYQIFAYLIGPLFMFSFLSIDFAKMKKPLIFFLIFLLLDSLIGFFINIGNERSLSFISNEPSHSARFFFSIIFICYLVRNDWRKKLTLISIIYVIFNSSFTGFIFLIAFIIYSNKNNLNIKKLIFIAFSLVVSIQMIRSTFPASRVTKQLNVILNIEANKINATDLANLTKIGSRRFTQSFLGYSLSKPFEGVGIGESSQYFINQATRYNISLKNLNNIYNRDNVTPNSYIAQLCYEIGYLNTLIFLFIISIPIIRLTKGLDKFLFIFGILQLLILSTTTFVTPWLFLALSVNEFLQSNKQPKTVHLNSI